MWFRTAFFTLLVTAWCRYGYPAALSAPNQTVSPGQTVVSLVAFAAEEQHVAALQFDLEWDGPMDVEPVIGDRLRQLSKAAYTVPLGPRAIRFVLVGINQQIVSDGELLKLVVIVDPE